ncbi:ribosome silencing factor [Pseudomonadota bacterium]
MPSKEIEKIKKVIVKQLEKLKIENIEIIDISGRSSLADYLIIGTGRSVKNIESAVELLNKELKKNDIIGIKPEGTSSTGWVILDIKDIIIHLFIEEVRIKYNIEEIFNKKH